MNILIPCRVFVDDVVSTASVHVVTTELISSTTIVTVGADDVAVVVVLHIHLLQACCRASCRA